MITVSHLSKQYGRRVVVDDVSFEVATGRVTGFVGPNGAGKSTTMRMMVGLSRPDRGEVRYRGVGFSDMLRPARVVGSVLDARCMHPGRTARDHLEAMARLSGISRPRVGEVLDDVGLGAVADQRAGGFSLGMRQRLALAGALLGRPEALLLDEPSNGLDPDGIRWLRHTLREFADRGGTVFVSSHLIAELAMFADDVVVVGRGRLLAAEPVATILARGEVVVHVRSPDAPALAVLLEGAGITVHVDGPTLTAHGTTADIVSRVAFDRQLRIVEIAETSRSLEEILLDITGTTAASATAVMPGALASTSTQ